MPGKRPDDIGDAVARLIVKLRSGATELHRWIQVDPDAAAGILLHAFAQGVRKRTCALATGERK